MKQTRLESNNDHQPLLSSTLPFPSSPVLESEPDSETEISEMKEEDAKTSGQVQLSATTLGQCSPKKESRVRKRTMRWVKWHRKKQQSQLVKAAEEVLSMNAVKHDTSQLMVVSAVIDGRRCKDVLIDPGASSNFVRQEWANGVGLRMRQLTSPLDVTLADGKVGARLTHAVQVNALYTQGSTAPCTLTVMGQLSHEVILGLPWLRKAGVTIDYEQMKWNGRPMYRVGVESDGSAELQAVAVAPEHEKRMAALVAAYPSAFSKELRDRTSADVAKAIKCCIVLKDPQCRPVKCRERRRSPKDEAALRTAVEEMLAKGLVRPSNSEWVSQPVMVKKVRDGVVLDEKRPCW